MSVQPGSGQGPLWSLTEVDSVLVVALTGRLSTMHAREVRDAIESAVAGCAASDVRVSADTAPGSEVMVLDPVMAIVVDLTRVRLIDAAVARTLRTTFAAVGRRGVKIGAAGAAGQPLEVFEILGIVKEIGAHRSLEQALDEARHGGADGARQSIEVRVHQLLVSAHALAEDDPERHRIENDAIEAALPLARTMAHRYQQRGEPMDDLIQVASLGVVRAVQGYHPDHGSGFLAYAVPTIVGELKRHFRDHAWTVRAPRRLQELRSMIAQTSADLSQQLAREPSHGDIAERLGVPTVEVQRAVATSSGLRPMSLDAPVGADTERSLHDTVGADDPDVEMVEYRTALEGLIASLPPASQEVLMLRFAGDLTQSEIAARLGTSQMNVSRMLSSILGRFRRALLAGD
jgi:RNA polymerase sigma-B factor